MVPRPEMHKVVAIAEGKIEPLQAAFHERPLQRHGRVAVMFERQKAAAPHLERIEQQAADVGISLAQLFERLELSAQRRLRSLHCREHVVDHFMAKHDDVGIQSPHIVDDVFRTAGMTVDLRKIFHSLIERRAMIMLHPVLQQRDQPRARQGLEQHARTIVRIVVYDHNPAEPSAPPRGTARTASKRSTATCYN